MHIPRKIRLQEFLNFFHRLNPPLVKQRLHQIRKHFGDCSTINPPNMRTNRYLDTNSS